MTVKWFDNFLKIEPGYWASLGIVICIVYSTFGSAWGIFIAGSTIMGATVHSPHISPRNVISIIFIEASAVYGIVVSIILTQLKFCDNQVLNYYNSYAAFYAGIVTGFGALFTSLSVGVLGSSISLADAANKTLFIKVLVLEIIATILGIFSVIVSINLASKFQAC